MMDVAESETFKSLTILNKALLVFNQIIGVLEQKIWL